MTTLESTIDTYLNAWTEQDPARRAQLIEEAWAPDGQLVDPPLSAQGRCEISDMASALQGSSLATVSGGQAKSMSTMAGSALPGNSFPPTGP